MGTATVEPRVKMLEEDEGFVGDFDFADVFEPSWDYKKPYTESPETRLKEIKIGIKKAMFMAANKGTEKTMESLMGPPSEEGYYSDIERPFDEYNNHTTEDVF
ncbi:hypothetical protein BHE90_004735 [Fusarium euwallaceae]|uniref:Uncharacterized protein n=1 Tax=Fusarium euwallaceae TaxID=1147111 RepID=A0A430LYD1_9HYPO|nr:hypothetical protein BHE90_004735 [Fusarium euwallaceae]